MPADLLRSVSRHQADDQTANSRNENHPIAKMCLSGRYRRGRQTSEESKVRENGDQPNQRLCNQRANRSNENGENRNLKNATISREIA